METNLIDLTKLKRDELQEDLYDLFIHSFVNINTGLYLTIITRKYEMRLDLLCVDLYGSAEYIGMIMKINDILNPFSVKIGDIIAYIPSDSLTDSLYTDPKVLNQQRSKLVNALKTTRVDNNRRKYLDNIGVPFALPPTIAPEGASKSEVENDEIKIGKDLFTNPNDNIGIPTPADDTEVTFPIVDTTTDDTETVLISSTIVSGGTVIESETFNDENTTDEE